MDQEKDSQWGACRPHGLRSASPLGRTQGLLSPAGLPVSTGPGGAQAPGGGGQSVARLWTYSMGFSRATRVGGCVMYNRVRTLENYHGIEHKY